MRVATKEARESAAMQAGDYEGLKVQIDAMQNTLAAIAKAMGG